jgi:AraC-like DNA-binding protein
VGLRFPPASGPGFHVNLQGTCWLLPGAEAEPIPLSAGDAVFVAQAKTVALANDPSTPLVLATQEMDDAWRPAEPRDRGPATTVLMCGSYRFNRIRPHPMLTELPDIIHIPRRAGRHSELSAVIELLGNELDGRRPGTDALVSGLLDVMLLYILRTWYLDQAPAPATGWSAALRDPAIGAALQYLHRDPVRPWTVEELGRRVGLSRAAFARRFTMLVGRPPLDYLTWWRMTQAGVLVRRDDSPLTSIAQRTGYTSESAFNRAFKREFGTTPGMYRRHVSKIVAPDFVSEPAAAADR